MDEGAQVYMYPSKLAIQLSVQYVQLNLIIILHNTSCGCTTKPFGGGLKSVGS